MNSEKTAIVSIPYEIIRREDGAIALSCAAGLLRSPPTHVRIDESDLILEDTHGLPLASLKLMPVDALDLLKRQGRLPFFESMRTAILQSHWLNLRGDT